MNIFILDENPDKAARLLDDKRTVKMGVETAQLLSTAGNYYKGQQAYKSSHLSHPCSKWVRETRGNYLWTLDYFIAITDEYTLRFGRVLKSVDYLPIFKSNIEYIPEGPLLDFCNCAKNTSLGIDYTNIKDTVLAYQLYIAERWERDKRPPRFYKIAS